MDFVKSELKNIVIFVAILGGLYFSYSYFFAGDSSITTTSGAIATDQSGGVGGDVLPLLLDLKKINLDQSVFSDQIFIHLKNYSTNLGNEDAGRDNPFAPVGAVSSSQQSNPLNLKTGQ